MVHGVCLGSGFKFQVWGIRGIGWSDVPGEDRVTGLGFEA